MRLEFSKRAKNNPQTYINCGVLHLNKLESSSLNDKWCFVPSLDEISPWVLKKKFCWILLMYFVSLLLSPLGKGKGPSFKYTWIYFTQGCSMSCLVEIGLVVPEKKNIKFIQYIFTLLLSSPLGKRTRSFQLINLHTLHPRMLCVSLAEIVLVVLEKQK